MSKTASYQINQIIYEDPYILIGHAYPQGSPRRKLLKMVKESNRIELENEKIMNEYRIASRLEMDGVLRPILPIVNGDAMALEYTPINGATLRRYFAMHQVSIGEFLQLGLRIADRLLELHRQKVVHLNIRPDTILIQPTTLRVFFAGFGYAVSFCEKHHLNKKLSLLESNPPYMSPEQTGRIHAQVDHRADLYALGVTLFEMLTGKLPFHATDALGWSHAHMAMLPALSDDDVRRLPQSLLRILFKLLAKDPEARYQSAWELRTDFLSSWLEVQTENRKPASLREAKKWSAVKESKTSVGAFCEPYMSYPQILDLAVIMQSSQIFVRETDEYQVIRELMTLIIKQAGAEKGLLVSVHNGKARVEWSAEVKHGQLMVSHTSLTLEACSEAPKSLIMKSLRSQEIIRIDGTGHIDESPRKRLAEKGSALCLPILIQDKIRGILYLENNLTSKAFVAERFAVLQQVSSQALYLTKYMAHTGNFLHDTKSDEVLASQGITLTAREREILRLMADGLSNKEMAQRLIVTPETVKAHLRNIYRKLKVNRRVEAVMAAYQLRLLNDRNTPFGG